MIPGSGLVAPTVTDNNQTSVQMDATREGDTASSIKAHGYAKVHKPSDNRGAVHVGADPPRPATTTPVPIADSTVDQTTL